MSAQSFESKNSMRRKNRGKEIVFDPEERRKYLRGFSERKQQRRSFGLAMQKVKDRLARLDDRREHRKSEIERIEEAERQKRTLLEEALSGTTTAIKSDHNCETMKKEKTATYHDMESTAKWGGQVVVTTKLASLSDESDAEDEMPRKLNIDRRQRYAGDVSKFINQMKGSLPAKKKLTGRQPRKGNHGATNMSGIGGAANLKLAKKALSKVQAKVGKPAIGKKRSKRSKK